VDRALGDRSRGGVVANALIAGAILVASGVIVADDSASRLRDLMQAPSLENVFSQLTVTADTDQLSNELLETVRF
jgi:hypothetical protein